MTEEKQTILERIQKLLKMSKENGASENEAMMAAERVQKLLQEHNLSLGDIKDNESVEPIDKESYNCTRDKWHSFIRSSTAKMYFCTTYTENKYDNNYKKVKVVTFVGRKSNTIVAKEMSDYFIDTVNRLAEEEFKTVPGSRSEINRMKQSFKMGCAAKLSNRIMEKYRELKGPDDYHGIPNPEGLPVLFRSEEEAIKEFLKNIGVSLSSRNTSYSIKDRVAYGRGSNKANDIGLDTQINANSRRYLSA